MSLCIDEIAPGIVAYFDTACIRRDLRVERVGSDSADTKPTRPYLCVLVSGDECVWLALTSQNPHGFRLSIDRSWRLGGTERWRTEDVFIQCFAKELRGPASAFVLAASRSDLQVSWNRPRLSDDGMRRVIALRERKMERLAADAIRHDPHLDQSGTTA